VTPIKLNGLVDLCNFGNNYNSYVHFMQIYITNILHRQAGLIGSTCAEETPFPHKDVGLQSALSEGCFLEVILPIAI